MLQYIRQKPLPFLSSNVLCAYVMSFVHHVSSVSTITRGLPEIIQISNTYLGQMFSMFWIVHPRYWSIEKDPLNIQDFMVQKV